MPKNEPTHNPQLSPEIEAQLRALSEADGIGMLPDITDLPSEHRSGIVALQFTKGSAHVG